ncbi:MAG: 5'/3'-nucleotidase SurE [Solirubrobacteraceae bacterium]|nr:5'/3'-nucleotidase SurE [Solirubrobacteraceae bacterium]
MRLLLTNDDGIEAEGLHAIRAALQRVPGIELMVIAPDGNRSATGRSITTRRPLVSRHVTFADGGVGYAIDGTPVDCVRLGWYELAGGRPDFIVAGINHGANLGDDVTFSGTVGAALEAHHLGVPGLAVSQIARNAGLGFSDEGGYDFRVVAAFAAELVARREEVGLTAGTVLNVNAPAGAPTEAKVTRLGRRHYKDALRTLPGEAPERAARHDAAEAVVTYGDAVRIGLYGVSAGHDPEEGTDLSVVGNGQISVTPVTLKWTDEPRRDALPADQIGAALTESDPAVAIPAVGVEDTSQAVQGGGVAEETGA